MSLFNTKEDQILDGLFGSGSPATYDLALSSTPPNEDGTGITEPVGNGYARVPITNNSVNFPPAVDGVKLNGADFQFPQASGSWGSSLGYWVLYASATPVMWGTLTPPKTILAGDTLRVPTGNMTLTCD